MRLALLLIGTILSGCASIPQTVTVKVPVPIKCQVQTPEKPALPIDRDIEPARIFDMSKAKWASIELLEAYARQLEAGLEACR